MSTPKAPISVFDSSLNKLCEVDTYESAYFEQSFSDYGGFEVKLNWNITDSAGFRYASYFVRGNFVLFGKDVNKCGLILETEKTINEGGKGSQILSAKGKQAKIIFNRRVVTPPAGQANYTATAVAETLMKALVAAQMGSTASAARQVSILNVPTTAGLGASYTYSSRYKTLSEDLRTISMATNLGYTLQLNLSTKKLDFVVIPGVDRTAGQSTNPRVIISTDLDTLRSGKLRDSDIVYRNIVYAAGQGVGENRNVRVVYSGSEPTGLDRREVFADMRDLVSNTDIDARGASVLAENSTTKFVDASALSYSQYVLGTDYNLGDIITLDVYDESQDVRITKVKESWGALKYDISLEFNRSYPELPKQITSTNNNNGMAFNNTEGVVVQSGSNANGYYVKWSDGTMVCWNRVATANINNSVNNYYGSASGTSYYVNHTVTFPVAFLSTPSVSGIIESPNDCILSIRTAPTTISVEFRLLSSISAGVGTLNWQAIGRWK